MATDKTWITVDGVVCRVDEEVKARMDQLRAENKRLQHFRDTSVGLWATDMPDKLTQEERDRCCLFELKGGE